MTETVSIRFTRDYRDYRWGFAIDMKSPKERVRARSLHEKREWVAILSTPR